MIEEAPFLFIISVILTTVLAYKVIFFIFKTRCADRFKSQATALDTLRVQIDHKDSVIKQQNEKFSLLCERTNKNEKKNINDLKSKG